MKTAFISLLACHGFFAGISTVIHCTKHAKTRKKIYLEFSVFVRRQSNGYFRLSEEKENIINVRISALLQISPHWVQIIKYRSPASSPSNKSLFHPTRLYRTYSIQKVHVLQIKSLEHWPLSGSDVKDEEPLTTMFEELSTKLCDDRMLKAKDMYHTYLRFFFLKGLWHGWLDRSFCL